MSFGFFVKCRSGTKPTYVNTDARQTECGKTRQLQRDHVFPPDDPALLCCLWLVHLAPSSSLATARDQRNGWTRQSTDTIELTAMAVSTRTRRSQLRQVVGYASSYDFILLETSHRVAEKGYIDPLIQILLLVL